jgi:hypothetical protein
VPTYGWEGIVGELAPGQEVVASATYSVTQADIDAGQVTNLATAAGTAPDGSTPTTGPESTVTPLTAGPALRLVKSATPIDPASYTPGREITYSFVVTNTGSVTVTDVAIVEGAFSGTGAMSPPSCPIAAASLAPGDQLTCTATYTLSQGDVDAGQLVNDATAQGTAPGGDDVVSNVSQVVVPGEPNPAATLVKTADRSTVGAAGDVITYSFRITNTGNVELTDVTVNEGTFSGAGSLSAIACPPEAASLLPGQFVTCTATYEVTRDDLTGATLVNTATASATPPRGDPITTDPAMAAVATEAPAPAPSTTTTSAPAPATPPAGRLVRTGVNSLPLAMVGLGLLAAGAAIAAVGRRRGRQRW